MMQYGMQEMSGMMDHDIGPRDLDKPALDLLSERLSAAVVSDALDRLGHRVHAMDADIALLDPATTLCGRAMTVAVEIVDEAAPPPATPYAGEIAMLDDIRSGEVVVIAGAGNRRAALWGELFSTAALARGGRGTVIDGYARDLTKIRQLRYPVVCRGGLPLDCSGRTRVVAWRHPVLCGGIDVTDGDLIFGDADGVIVVPSHLVTRCLDAALQKVSRESEAAQAIAAGSLVAEAYERYRVL